MVRRKKKEESRTSARFVRRGMGKWYWKRVPEIICSGEVEAISIELVHEEGDDACRQRNLTGLIDVSSLL